MGHFYENFCVFKSGTWRTLLNDKELVEIVALLKQSPSIGSYHSMQGFILATGQASTESQARTPGLVIAQLPSKFRLDMPWPMQKFPLRATPHKIIHIPEYSIYAMLLSKEVPTFVCLQISEVIRSFCL